MNGQLRVAVAGLPAADIAPPEGVVVAEAVAESDLVVCVGESALLEHSDHDGPLLPVDAGRGVRSVQRESLPDALASVAGNDHEEWSIPSLSIDSDGEHLADAVLDVMLVTAEPAHISEFSVGTPLDHVDQFRADGVHVSTAAGTSGYARRVDAPVFAPETPAFAIVPIAPFSIDSDHWVVPVRETDPVVTVTVERDDAAVTLLADERTVGPVTPHQPVSITVDGSVRLVRTPESRSPFSDPDGNLR